MLKRFLISCLFVFVVSCIPQPINTDAFTAQIQSDNWTVQLKPDYFSPEVKSVSVTFGSTLYGVYLTTDKLVLPSSSKPKKLTLTGYDSQGKPVMKNTFMLPE